MVTALTNIERLASLCVCVCIFLFQVTFRRFEDRNGFDYCALKVYSEFEFVERLWRHFPFKMREKKQRKKKKKKKKKKKQEKDVN